MYNFIYVTFTSLKNIIYLYLNLQFARPIKQYTEILLNYNTLFKQKKS